jgi:hypothetical protein
MGPVRMVLVLTSLTVALTLAACGSPTSAATKKQDCTAVADVLSDGPDPGADPAGYAEAQVLPLRQLHLADPTIRQAVGDLDSAYQALSSASAPAAASAGKRVATVEAKLNAICPGAAP